ncbi:MAG: SIS domain-containing protein [Tepidisphaeraceae bacterium]
MSGSICTTARDYLAGLSKLAAQVDPKPIDALTDLLFKAWTERRRVFVFGNGGSASTSSHFVCDLVKTACVPGRRRLDVIALVDNIPLMTALGNDVSYDDIFRFPLETCAKPGDIAIGISCSGKSPNLLRACEWANANGLTVVALTGFSGGTVKDLAQLHINIPSDNYGWIEDLHLSVNHMVAQELHARIKAQA